MARPATAAQRPRRPNRSAAERRAQALRAQARVAQHLLRAFWVVAGHRGQRLGSFGGALLQATDWWLSRAQGSLEELDMYKSLAVSDGSAVSRQLSIMFGCSPP